MVSGARTEAPALEAHLRARRDGGSKLIVAYVTGGLGAWTDTVAALADAGADAVEIGLPFSDPVMDGPTIQAASAQALASGATPRAILEASSRIDPGIPLAVMTYYNLVFRAGHERFAGLLAAAGLSGAVVPDLPLEESADWEAQAAAAGVATVLLAAPVTPDDRLDELCRRSRGFVYAVSRMGTTGERDDVAASAAVLARRCHARTDTPVLIGMGITGPGHAVEACRHADGVVVGSAVVRRLLEGGGPADAGRFVASLRRALDEGSPS